VEHGTTPIERIRAEFGGQPLHRHIPTHACRHTDRFSVQKLTELKRIGWRRALLVVVEINEYVAALPFPGFDALGPIAEHRGAIMAFVAAARSMSSDIDKIGGTLPGCRRVVMVRQAERDIVFRQQPQNARIIPTGMSKFETVAALPRKQLEERSQPIRIGLKMWW
jgi:hypothetical protein